MKLTEVFIKLIGLALIILGFCLILSALGVTTGVALPPVWLGIVVGLILLVAGIVLIRGGNITL